MQRCRGEPRIQKLARSSVKSQRDPGWLVRDKADRGLECLAEGCVLTSKGEECLWF